MYILVDCRPLQDTPFYGTENFYSWDFFEALLRNYPDDIFYFWTNSEHFPKNFPDLDQYHNAHKINTSFKPRSLQFFTEKIKKLTHDDLVETELMRRGLLPWISQIDAVFSLSPYSFSMDQGRMKCFFMPDLFYLHFPEEVPSNTFEIFTKKSAYTQEFSDANLLFVPTEFSAEDAVKTCSADKNTVVNIGFGITSDFTRIDDLEPYTDFFQEYDLTDRFFIVPYEKSTKKNFLEVLRAFSLFLSRFEHENILLLVIEKDPFESQISTVLQDQYPFVRSIKSLLLEQKNILFSAAQGYLFPVLYDGIPLEPLQAMKCGCPVISSSYSSLSTVFGSAAIYFDPSSYQSIFSALKDFFADEQVKYFYSEQALQKSSEDIFLWDNVAKNCMEKVYELQEEIEEENL